MRVWPLLILVPFLAGCTDADWDRMLGFGSSDNARRQSVAVTPPQRTPVATTAPATTAPAPPAPAPAQAAAAAAMNPFCLGVARQDATTHDFDTGTQQKVAVRSYQQCVQIFGATPE
jgi:hypothetical protein